MVNDKGLLALLKHRVSPTDDLPRKSYEEITIDIIDYIRKNRAELYFEDIMEALAAIGRAPQLVNNDNGGWYITDSGMNTIITDEDIINEPLAVGEFVTWVRNRAWKESIRGALYDYLDRENEDIPTAEENLNS